MDAAVLKTVFGLGDAAAQKWAGPLTLTMVKYAINSPERAAAFLAQVAHESGRFLWVTELWGPTPIQRTYERDFSAAWPPTPNDKRNRKAFELGNDAAGDGKKFRGHGLIQVTGKRNHTLCGAALGLNLITAPEQLAVPINAAMSAGWYWDTHSLNALADKRLFLAITHRINGGEMGEAEREAFYNKLLGVL